MFHKNKKALSEIVGYTLLIVIALSLSVMVYSFLRVYVPKEKVECDKEVNLIIRDYSCTLSELNLTITNKGLFKADAVYIRFGEESQKIKNQINNNSFLLFGPNNTVGLNPGESSNQSYDISLASPGQYGVELQPVVIKNKQLIVCESAIISLPIQCG